MFSDTTLAIMFVVSISCAMIGRHFAMKVADRRSYSQRKRRWLVMVAMITSINIVFIVALFGVWAALLLAPLLLVLTSAYLALQEVAVASAWRVLSRVFRSD